MALLLVDRPWCVTNSSCSTACNRPQRSFASFQQAAPVPCRQRSRRCLRSATGHAGGSAAGEHHHGWEPECKLWLAQRLGVKDSEAGDWLAKSARKRAILATKGGAPPPQPISVAHVQHLVELLTDGDAGAGMTPKAAAAVLHKWPRLLACEPAHLAAVFRFYRQELGLSAAQTALQIRGRPQMLSHELAVLRQRAQMVRSILHLDEKQLAKVVGQSPALLRSTAANIEQLVSAAAAQLGCSTAAYGKATVQHSRLLSVSPAHQQAVLDWCRAAGGRTQEQASDMVLRQPQIMTFSCASLQRNFSALAVTCGLSQQQAVALIYQAPGLLVRDVSTPVYARKLQFLQQVIGQPPSALGRCPMYIAYSLENRSAPRTCFLLERGVGLTPSLGHLPLSPQRFYERFRVGEAEFADWTATWRRTSQGRQWGTAAAGTATRVKAGSNGEKQAANGSAAAEP